MNYIKDEELLEKLILNSYLKEPLKIKIIETSETKMGYSLKVYENIDIDFKQYERVMITAGNIKKGFSIIVDIDTEEISEETFKKIKYQILKSKVFLGATERIIEVPYSMNY